MSKIVIKNLEKSFGENKVIRNFNISLDLLMRIHGTFCASLTPFNNDYTINHDMFFNHCNDLINKGADYIAIFIHLFRNIRFLINCCKYSFVIFMNKFLAALPATGTTIGLYFHISY